MVLLIMTREGYEEVRSLITPGGPAVWVNAGVLSDAEVDSMLADGIEISRFSNPTTVDRARPTIAMHHPGERVWPEIQIDDEE